MKGTRNSKGYDPGILSYQLLLHLRLHVWTLHTKASPLVFCRRLMERLENMKRSAVGNGLSQCLLCGEALGLLGTPSVLCFDCCKVQHLQLLSLCCRIVHYHNSQYFHIALAFWDKIYSYRNGNVLIVCRRAQERPLAWFFILFSTA